MYLVAGQVMEQSVAAAHVAVVELIAAAAVAAAVEAGRPAVAEGSFAP